MLSRTAGNLYWIGRYVERADATARLLGMGARMTMLPGASTRGDWQSVLQTAGVPLPDGNLTGRRDVIDELLLARTGSSIRGCFELARAAGRAERTALTTLMWEALNDDWRALEGVDISTASRSLPDHIDWTHKRAATFRGAMDTTMLRDDRFEFLRLGGLIERAAMTLRLLDVKYLALLPERDVVGGGRDLHQWTSLLLAASALRAYHHVYRGDVQATNVADLLLLNRAFPRAVALCADEAEASLERLAKRYDERHECHDRAGALCRRLGDTDVETVFADGLHEFVTEALREVLALHNAVAEAYRF